MNQRDRAINLGLKINSLKGNLSVANSVIKELKDEINNAVIDDSDREQLIALYERVVLGLKSVVSPSVTERNKINQQIEDANTAIRKSSNFHEIDKVDGFITAIEESVQNPIFKREHKVALKSKIEYLRESHKKKTGQILKKNYTQLHREIEDECHNENPFHVSVVIKKFNNKIKITPLFKDDRHDLQALLDTKWQQSALDIKIRKDSERE